MIFPHGTVVTRLRRQRIPAAHGNSLVHAGLDDSEHPPERREITGACIAPKSSSRTESAGREQSHEQMSLYAPVDVDVEVGDVLDVAGELWEISGEPRNFRNPFTGWAAGSETPIERYRG